MRSAPHGPGTVKFRTVLIDGRGRSPRQASDAGPGLLSAVGSVPAAEIPRQAAQICEDVWVEFIVVLLSIRGQCSIEEIGQQAVDLPRLGQVRKCGRRATARRKETASACTVAPTRRRCMVVALLAAKSRLPAINRRRWKLAEDPRVDARSTRGSSRATLFHVMPEHGHRHVAAGGVIVEWFTAQHARGEHGVTRRKRPRHRSWRCPPATADHA